VAPKPPWSYCRILATEGISSGLSLRSDNLDSVGQLYIEDNFGQLGSAKADSVNRALRPMGGARHEEVGLILLGEREP
jgi:hypothetical protein